LGGEAQSALSAREVRPDCVERSVQFAIAHRCGDQRVFGKNGFNPRGVSNGLRVRKATIWSRPSMNSARFRQWLSTV
jgi:hypothetical protein